jgi:hypothetical protein
MDVAVEISVQALFRLLAERLSRTNRLRCANPGARRRTALRPPRGLLVLSLQATPTAAEIVCALGRWLRSGCPGHRPAGARHHDTGATGAAALVAGT